MLVPPIACTLLVRLFQQRSHHLTAPGPALPLATGRFRRGSAGRRPGSVPKRFGPREPSQEAPWRGSRARGGAARHWRDRDGSPCGSGATSGTVYFRVLGRLMVALVALWLLAQEALRGAFGPRSSGAFVTCLDSLNSCFEFRRQRVAASRRAAGGKPVAGAPVAAVGHGAFFALHPGLGARRCVRIVIGAFGAKFGSNAAASLLAGVTPALLRGWRQVAPFTCAFALLQVCPGDPVFAELQRWRLARFLLAAGVVLYRLRKFLFVIAYVGGPPSGALSYMRWLIMALLFIDGNSLMRRLDTWLCFRGINVKTVLADVSAGAYVVWNRNAELIALILGLAWCHACLEGNTFDCAVRVASLVFAACTSVRRFGPVCREMLPEHPRYGAQESWAPPPTRSLWHNIDGFYSLSQVA
mmetsp:Transcript_88492/g.245811  ORF Transcript_88492/g.245811 Transcript_88492/m.245811 type:complete len:413 (-) Transcript_88492:665-1903(-)